MSKSIITKPQVGDKVGKLTILEIIPGQKNPRIDKRAHCLCDCGNESYPKYFRLYTKGKEKVRSCGCVGRNRFKTHDMYYSSEYNSYKRMKGRCLDPKNNRFYRYGARGIKICKRWLGINGFKNFYADMGPKPTPCHTIDRINNNGDYKPSNCRWATNSEQQANK